MKKDCAFQYATESGIVRESTGLITRNEADALFEKYKPQFRIDLERGLNPEMGVWINMSSESDYRDMGQHIDSCHLEIRGGRIYRVTEIDF